MKIPKFSFARNIFKRIKVSGSQNPYRDWFVIMCCFSCASVFLLALAGGLYYEIDNDMIFRGASASDDAPLKIDRESIESVSGYYKNQEKAIEEIISGNGASVDPSV